MPDITLHTLLTRILVLLPIIAVYGFTLPWAAARMGDPGPSQDGRATLNPLAHLDSLGAIAFLVFGMGWIRPLSIDPAKLHGKVMGLIAVLLAGFISLLLLALAAVLLLPWVATAFSFSGAPLVGGFLVTLARLAVAFAVVNFIPLPPLTAGQFLVSLFPRLSELLAARQVILGLVMLALLATSIPGKVLAPVNEELLRLLSRDSAMVSTLR